MSTAAQGAGVRCFAVPLHLKSLADADVLAALRGADFVILQNLAGGLQPEIDALRPAGSHLFRIPDLIMRSLWPFDGEAGVLDEATLEIDPLTPKHRQDGALATLRLQEPDKARRLERYRRLEFDMAGSLDRIFAAQDRFLEDVESSTPTGVCRLILRRVRDTQLFYNSTHPGRIVLQPLCEFVWLTMGLAEPVPAFPGLDDWQNDSIPVHPELARKLGLQWASEFTRYNCGSLGMLTWEEWARHYIRTFG